MKRTRKTRTPAALVGPIAARPRRVPQVPLSQIRLSDLLAEVEPPELRNVRAVRLPAKLLDEVSQVAARYGTTNTDALIALINEGLAAAKQRR